VNKEPEVPEKEIMREIGDRDMLRYFKNSEKYSLQHRGQRIRV
jgi:hypothetical protein